MSFILYALFCLHFSARAVVSMPEYVSFGEGELRRVEGPGLVGSEYQSDFLAYSKPFGFESQFIRASKAFDVSVGSLGPKTFLTNNRLKLSTLMLPGLEFKLIHFSQADFERDFAGTIFEFSYALGSLALAGYGEVSTQKSQDDIGVALIWQNTEHHKLRFFYTAVDFSFNQRNVLAQGYEKQPSAFGFVGRWLSEEESFWEYSLRFEPLIRRNAPAEGWQHSYANTVVNIHGTKKISTTRFNYVNFDVVWRNRFEQRVDALTPSVEGWSSDQLEILGQYETIDGIFGIRYVNRYWQSDVGSVVHNDVLPHYWYKFTPSDYGLVQANFNLGYEFTWHRGAGAQVLRSTLDRNNVVEHRANIRYDLYFNQNIRLNLLLSVDLDEFGSGETWEGGNAQFIWVF